METKIIEYNGDECHKIGCRKCGEGDWDIFINPIKGMFIAVCQNCRHFKLIKNKEIVDKPDNPNIYDLRSF